LKEIPHKSTNMPLSTKLKIYKKVISKIKKDYEIVRLDEYAKSL